MAKRKKKWNSDKLLGISAMTISFITLIIFIYQTNLMRKQNYLSILPYLSLSTTNNSGDNSFSLSIENQGVGPAIIESVILKHSNDTFDLADYNDDLLTFLQEQKPVLDSIKVISYATLEKGMAIPVNDSYNILEVRQSEADYRLLKTTLDELLATGLRFEIIYRSIQNERWMITNLPNGPQKLN